jgi:hypothetical protein
MPLKKFAIFEPILTKILGFFFLSVAIFNTLSVNLLGRAAALTRRSYFVSL